MTLKVDLIAKRCTFYPSRSQISQVWPQGRALLPASSIGVFRALRFSLKAKCYIYNPHVHEVTQHGTATSHNEGLTSLEDKKDFLL